MVRWCFPQIVLSLIFQRERVSILLYAIWNIYVQRNVSLLWRRNFFIKLGMIIKVHMRQLLCYGEVAWILKTFISFAQIITLTYGQPLIVLVLTIWEREKEKNNPPAFLDLEMLILKTQGWNLNKKNWS